MHFMQRDFEYPIQDAMYDKYGLSRVASHLPRSCAEKAHSIKTLLSCRAKFAPTSVFPVLGPYRDTVCVGSSDWVCSILIKHQVSDTVWFTLSFGIASNGNLRVVGPVAAREGLFQ
jgi:hypothetical protein